MDRQGFTYWLQRIYAAFGKTPNAATMSAVFRRVDGLPDGFFEYAAERLEDRETLPVNLGRELRHALWSEYLEKHPERRATPTACRDCDAATPGFFIAWDAKGKSWFFKCACNEDRHYENRQPWTRKQALEAGYSLTLPDVVDAPEKSHSLPPSARKALGHAERPRPEHVAQREYCDAGGW